MSHFCSQCGAQLSGPFCSSCGAKDADADHPSAVVPTDVSVDRQSLQKLATLAIRWFLACYVTGRLIDLAVGLMMSGVEGTPVLAMLLGIAINAGIACWLMWLAGNGSLIARRVYCWLVGIVGAIIVLGSLIGAALMPVAIGALECVAVVLLATAYVQSIRIVLRMRPILHRASAEGGATRVTLKTEMPSFVATIVLVLLAGMQFWNDVLRPR